MLDEINVKKAGKYLFDRHVANEPLDVMLQEFAPTNMQQAYMVQTEYVNLLSQVKGDFGGYKIAYTTPEMQERTGISEPCMGRMFAKEIVNSPATLKSADFVELAIECEVGVKLSSDLTASGAPYTRDSVSDAIEYLATAFEIVDFRYRPNDLEDRRVLSAVSTNVTNAGAVLGTPVSDWQSIDLAASQGTMTINGELVGEGHGSDVMGHPIEPLVWLANTLAMHGISMPAGSIIITGSIITPKLLKAGDEAIIEIEGLGEARLNVT